MAFFSIELWQNSNLIFRAHLLSYIYSSLQRLFHEGSSQICSLGIFIMLDFYRLYIFTLIIFCKAALLKISLWHSFSKINIKKSSLRSAKKVKKIIINIWFLWLRLRMIIVTKIWMQNRDEENSLLFNEDQSDLGEFREALISSLLHLWSRVDFQIVTNRLLLQTDKMKKAPSIKRRSF